MLVQPVRFKRAMLDAKHEYERDIEERLCREPAAPKRAGGGRPAAVRPRCRRPCRRRSLRRPAARRSHRDEVTRTLNSLADLRDRGAISADEFERKKADLLGRL